MKSHRPPLKRCATNDGMGGRRCSWGLINMAARVRQGRRRGPLPVPAPSLGCERPKISLGFDPTGGGYYPRPDKRQETHMALLGLGYAGFGSDALDDWRQFGTGLVGLQAVERGNSLLAFLRLGGRRRGGARRAGGAAGGGWCPRRGRTADAGRHAARARSDLFQRS